MLPLKAELHQSNARQRKRRVSDLTRKPILKRPTWEHLLLSAHSFKEFSQAMESSKAAIEMRMPISVQPNSFPQLPNSKSEALDKWFQPFEKTQCPPNGSSLGKVMTDEEGGNTVGLASRASHRANAPPVSMGSKAGKKRSRASRKAPTTVLSTDAWNFRAMVQHFTGFHQSNSSHFSFPAPVFHNNPPLSLPLSLPLPPASHSSFMFHHDFNPSPFFHPRVNTPTPLGQTSLMDDVGLNRAGLERRTGYGYIN